MSARVGRLAAIAMVIGLAMPIVRTAAQTATPRSTLRDLSSVDQLRSSFDKDREKVRIVLLLSPT